MYKERLTYSQDIRYSKDLTSHQIWSVLIGLLIEAGRPLCTISGDFIFDLLGSVCNLSTSSRRKIAAVESPEMLPWVTSKLVELAANNTPEKRIQVYQELMQKGVERNIVVDHLVMAMQRAENTEPWDPFKLDRHIQFYLNMYERFRKDVFNRYYDLMVVAANKNHFVKKSSGLNVSKLDMVNTYTVAVYRAIDKFVPFRGTLTSYIQTWFQFAEGGSSFAVYDNEAVSINRDVRRRVREEELPIKTQGVNFDLVSNQMEAEENTETDMYYAEIAPHIAMLENASLPFLVFGLPYTLTEEDKELIRKHNADRGFV